MFSSSLSKFGSLLFLTLAFDDVLNLLLLFGIFNILNCYYCSTFGLLEIWLTLKFINLTTSIKSLSTKFLKIKLSILDLELLSLCDLMFLRMHSEFTILVVLRFAASIVLATVVSSILFSRESVVLRSVSCL